MIVRRSTSSPMATGPTDRRKSQTPRPARLPLDMTKRPLQVTILWSIPKYNITDAKPFFERVLNCWLHFWTMNKFWPRAADLRWTVQVSRHGAVRAGAHFATTVLPYRDPKIDPSWLPITEIAEPMQRIATKLHRVECTCCFCGFPTYAAYSWPCPVLTRLILLLRDVVEQFLNPFVLGYCKIDRPTA